MLKKMFVKIHVSKQIKPGFWLVGKTAASYSKATLKNLSIQLQLLTYIFVIQN